MRNVRALSCLTALVTAAAVAGCAQQAPPRAAPGDVQLLRAEGVSRLEPAKDAPVADTVAGLRTFAEQFSAASAPEAENFVFSPTSIGYAFAMLRAGAGGETARQLDEVFGFRDPGVHEAFNALSRGIVTTDDTPPRAKPGATRAPGEQPKPPVVSIANGLFVQKNLRLGDVFLRTLAEQYGAGAQVVDFTADTAKETIDEWVREQTADRIDKLFDQLDPDTIAVLANAVYLKADWAMPFEDALTKDENFRLADGGTVSAPMMRMVKPGALNYARDDGWQAVELPYAGGELAMWVVVPTGDDLQPPRLSAELLAGLRDSERKTVDVVMPRWDFGTEVALLPELEKVGLTDLTDLRGIYGGAYVSDAIHRANITVDESGTEAAAVTGIAVAVSAGPGPDVTVRADRPFGFAIVHTPTGAPMFLGTVADPTAD